MLKTNQTNVHTHRVNCAQLSTVIKQDKRGLFSKHEEALNVNTYILQAVSSMCGVYATITQQQHV